MPRSSRMLTTSPNPLPTLGLGSMCNLHHRLNDLGLPRQLKVQLSFPLHRRRDIDVREALRKCVGQCRGWRWFRAPGVAPGM